MANLLLAITTNPQAFASGAWPSVEMDGSTWRFTFTFTSSSASGAYAGYHALFTAPNGGNSGGLWIAGDTLEFYNLADQILVARTMSWSAGATLRLKFDMVAKTIAINGMATGNGVVSWSGSGPYFNGSDTLTAGGLVGEVGYDIAGTFGNIDDGVDRLVVDEATIGVAPASVGLYLNRRLTVDAAAIGVAADDVGLYLNRRIAIEPADVGVAAEDVDLRLNRRLSVGSAAIGVAPSDIDGRRGRRLVIDPVTIGISPSSIGLLPSNNDPHRLLENAIWTWVVAGSGLSEANVIWGRVSAKNGPMPAGTFISMRLIASQRVSNDWLKSRADGGTIEHRIEGTRHPTLEITCFAGEPYGADTCERILDRVLSSIRLPSVAAALKTAGVGVGRRERIRVVDGTRSGMLDPRAIVEVGLHLGFVMVDPVAGSAIETVQVTNEITGEEFEVAEP